MKTSRVRFKLTGLTANSFLQSSACQSTLTYTVMTSIGLPAGRVFSSRYKDISSDVFVKMLFNAYLTDNVGSTLTLRDYLLRKLLGKVIDGSLVTSLKGNSTCAALTSLSTVHHVAVTVAASTNS